MGSDLFISELGIIKTISKLNPSSNHLSFIITPRATRNRREDSVFKTNLDRKKTEINSIKLKPPQRRDKVFNEFIHQTVDEDNLFRIRHYVGSVFTLSNLFPSL